MHVWLNTGDAGPDQAGFRNSLHTEFASCSDYDFMLLFSVACLKHQYHLAARGQLALADWCLKAMGKDFKYFSSLATLSHTWRRHLKKHVALGHGFRKETLQSMRTNGYCCARLLLP